MSNTTQPVTTSAASVPATVTVVSSTPDTNQIILKTLKHFGIMAGLAAVGAIILGIIALVGGINIATLPVAYQVFAATLIPMIVAALKNAQAEIAAELAAEQAKDQIALANATAEAATAKLAELTKSMNTPIPTPTPVTKKTK